MTPEKEIAELKLQLEELRGLLFDVQQQVGKVDHPLRESYVFLAKVAGATFQERTVEGSTFTDFGDGRTDAAAPLAMEAGGSVVMEIPDNGTMRYVRLNGDTRWCRVQQSGGVAGDDTTDCTFTYDIYELDNTTKINVTGGVVTPKGIPRVAKVTYTAATYGLFGTDADGSYILMLVNEQPTQEGCS